LATGDKNISETRNGWATRGFFGRINYDFKGKYLCELNGRYDGSSRFIGKNRWGWFPSISVGWNIAHENFMQSLNHILNTFKIRASYGHLGNQSGAALYTFGPNDEYFYQRDLVFSQWSGYDYLGVLELLIQMLHGKK